MIDITGNKNVLWSNNLGKYWIEQNKANLFLSCLDPLNMLIYTVNLVNAKVECQSSVCIISPDLDHQKTFSFFYGIFKT